MLTIEEITEWVKHHGEGGGEVRVIPVGDSKSIVFNMWFRDELFKGVCIKVINDSYVNLTAFDVLHLLDEDLDNPEILSRILWVAWAANLIPFICSVRASEPERIGNSLLLTALRRPLDINEFEADMEHFSTNILMAHRHLHTGGDNDG